MISRKLFRKPVARLALVGAALLSAQIANASIVSVDFSGNALSVVPFDLSGLYIDLAAGTASTDPTALPGWDINPFYLVSTNGAPARFDLYTPDYTGGIVVAGIIPSIPAEQLPIGAVIGPNSYYKDGIVAANAGDSTIHYIGFRFLNETTQVEDYGYLEIQQTIVPAAEGSVQILGWTYDDSGAALTVGGVSAVPEPATYAMFGAGLLAATFGARRRRAR